MVFPSCMAYLVVLLTSYYMNVRCLERNTFIMSYEEACTVSTADLTSIVLNNKHYYFGVNYNDIFGKNMFRKLSMNAVPYEEQQVREYIETLLIQRASELREERLKHLNKHPLAQDTVDTNSKRKLLELKNAQQRDLLMATLDCIVSIKETQLNNVLLSDCSKNSKAVAEYLHELHVEIVKDATGNEMEYLNAAFLLPCVLSPIEMDNVKRISSANSLYPNDFGWKACLFPGELTPHQWGFMGPDSRFCREPFGAGVTEAWSITTGGDSAPTVAVVDTGCFKHPDLEMNYCKKGEKCAGYDFADDDDDPFLELPISMHGTSVTSVIAAKGNNRFGIAGVCWSCKIMCIKIMESISNEMSKASVLKAYNFLVSAAEKGVVKISNHSYNGFGYSLAEFRAIQKLHIVGHLIVVSAGNDACDVDKVIPGSPLGFGCINQRTMGYIVPGSYDIDNIIVVGSIQRQGNVAELSNWGEKHVHIFAPGTSIPVTSNICSDRRNDGIRVNTGTSFAAPLVAGVAALLLSLKPSLTHMQLRGIILNTARKYPRLAGKCLTGGVLDAVEAVKGVGVTPANKERSLNPTPTLAEIEQLCSGLE